MKNKVIILHEYGAPEHFRGLIRLQQISDRHFELEFIEFRIVKNFVKALLKLDIYIIIKNIKNFFLIVKLLFEKDNLIVLGMAPYDGFVILAKRLAKHNCVIYYSSWPYWDFTNYPKKVWFASKYIQKNWIKFFPLVRYVGVIECGRKNYIKSNACIKSWVIPHSIDINTFYYYHREIKHAKKINIIYVGRLVPEKGIRLIYDIAKQLNPNIFSFTFVGDGFREEKELILKLVDTMPSVRYMGQIHNQEKLAELYREMDVILLPSIKTNTWEELFGIVLIEAMACGVVPVVTDCIGPKSIITNNVNGIIIPQNNLQALKETLIMLSSNLILLHTLSLNAVAEAQNYSIDSCAELWRGVLTDCQKQ